MPESESLLLRRVGVASIALQSATLGWARVAGLGIAIVIAGQFSGWNYALAVGGWGGLLVATLLMALFYLGFIQCVAELAGAMPSVGGCETYCRRALGEGAGYVVGASVLVALTGAIGVVTNFAAAYGESVLGIRAGMLEFALFAAILAFQLRGAREAAGATLVVGAIAIGTLLLFAGAMVPFMSTQHLVSAAGGGLFPHGLNGVFAAIPFALWMFLGVEQTAVAAEEAADPGRTVPKALTVALGTLLTTGLAIVIFAPGGGGVDRIASADDPLYAAITSPSAYGAEGWLTAVIGGGALIGLIATFFSLFYTCSRQLYSLARDGYLPQWLASTNRRKAPYVSLLVVAAGGIVAANLPAEEIMVLVIFLLNASYLVVLVAFIRLRRHEPQLPRPYRALGGTVTAAATIALSLLVLSACFAQHSAGPLYALGLYGALTGQFTLVQRHRSRLVRRSDE